MSPTCTGATLGRWLVPSGTARGCGCPAGPSPCPPPAVALSAFPHEAGVRPRAPPAPPRGVQWPEGVRAPLPDPGVGAVATRALRCGSRHTRGATRLGSGSIETTQKTVAGNKLAPAPAGQRKLQVSRELQRGSRSPPRALRVAEVGRSEGLPWDVAVSGPHSQKRRPLAPRAAGSWPLRAGSVLEHGRPCPLPGSGTYTWARL